MSIPQDELERRLLQQRQDLDDDLEEDLDTEVTHPNRTKHVTAESNSLIHKLRTSQDNLGQRAEALRILIRILQNVDFRGMPPILVTEIYEMIERISGKPRKS